MEINFDQIRHINFQQLPAGEAHKKMIPPYRELELPSHKKAINSAVLILFFYWENELCICLNIRKRNLRKHGGQISFPGGRCEKSETIIETALRETEEEIGLSNTNIEIIGTLSSLYIPVSNFLVHPVIGIHSSLPQFEINPDEVEENLIIPVVELLNPKYLISKKIQTSIGLIKVPCFQIHEQIIWGATSMILAELVMLLKPDYFDREAHLNNADNER